VLPVADAIANANSSAAAKCNSAAGHSSFPKWNRTVRSLLTLRSALERKAFSSKLRASDFQTQYQYSNRNTYEKLEINV